MTVHGVAPRQVLEVRPVAPARWREACRRELDDGGRFCGAHASGDGEERTWNALFADGARTRLLRTPGAGELETIVDLAAAATDEREAHDLRGLRFAGHEPLRPLAAHTDETPAWTVPVEGRGVHQVAVGPIHAGVIESGHFRFHVVGERILQLDTKLFYKHRGLERAAEGRDLAGGLAFAQRACGACAVTNSVAYAQACEGALGMLPSRQLRRARTLLLELERLYNHLNDIGAVCAGVGFATGNAAFAALKERALRLNLELCGHRYLFGTVALGANPIVLGSREAGEARERLRELRVDTDRVWREVRFSASVQARLDAVGVLDREVAARLGAVGPAARASGLDHDARRDSAGLWYDPSFTAARRGERQRRCRGAGGDARNGAGELLRAARRPAGGADRGRRRRPGRSRHADRGRSGREPAGGERLRGRAGERGPAPDAAPHRFLRQLARAGRGHRGQPPARLSADQQELRALLRLRGSLSRVRPPATPAPSSR